MKKILFSVVMAILLGSAPCSAADKRVYLSKHINPHAPAIDGRGDDPCWEKAEWGGGFTQDDPRCGEAPSEATEFKVMYDDKNLYVLVRCHDSQAATIDRRVARRDEIDGDYVAVYIDSYFDKRTAFGFKVNAAGVKADATLSGDSNSQDATWDAALDGQDRGRRQGLDGRAGHPLQPAALRLRDDADLRPAGAAHALPQAGDLLVGRTSPRRRRASSATSASCRG